MSADIIKMTEEQNKYVEDIKNITKKYRVRYLSHAFAHNTLNIITVVGAVIVPFLLQLKMAEFIPTTISILVAAAAAISHFFKFGERRRIYRIVHEVLKRELVYFTVRGGAYKGIKPEEAFDIFLNQTPEVNV